MNNKKVTKITNDFCCPRLPFTFPICHSRSAQMPIVLCAFTYKSFVTVCGGNLVCCLEEFTELDMAQR